MTRSSKHVASPADHPSTESPHIGAMIQPAVTHTGTVIRLLNDALATELVSVLRYRCHYFLALTIHLQVAAKQFITRSNAGQQHADQLAERIMQLGGTPVFSPDKLTPHSRTEYFSCGSLASIVREDLLAAGRLFDSYHAMISSIASSDIVTRHVLEDILAAEEAHADELSELLVARFRDNKLMLQTQGSSRSEETHTFSSPQPG